MISKKTFILTILQSSNIYSTIKQKSSVTFYYPFLLTLLYVMVIPVFAETVKQGQYLGAKTSETPDWFKNSFLEFEEDVNEAAEQHKRVMIYFHQEGCPYCAKLVDENFTNPQIESYVRQNFDGISINMWGDREIISIGGRSYTEKTFAEALKVQYTPTILFLNEQGKVILRLNGYYSPEKFKQALHYVAQKQESQMSFNDYLLADQVANSTPLISEDFFLDQSNLSLILKNSDKPLAIYFESSVCSDCEVMHSKILKDAPTRQLVNKMNNIQLNISSDDLLISPDGKKMSQREFARQLNIIYTPTVVILDQQGKEVHRMDGFLKTFHFQSSLAYVLEEAYLTQPGFQRYISDRGEKLRELGYDTDIWSYKSAYPAELSK